MTYIKYRSARVNVSRQGTAVHNGKKMVKVKTLEPAGKRPKGSIDWRSPDKVYPGKA